LARHEPHLSAFTVEQVNQGEGYISGISRETLSRDLACLRSRRRFHHHPAKVPQRL
jgi:hypothetical protein